MQVTVFGLMAFSCLVYSASPLETISHGPHLRSNELTSFQFFNVQNGSKIKFPRLTIQKIGKKACKSGTFFYNFAIAIREALNFICLKPVNSDLKNYQEVLESIAHWKKLTTSSDSPFDNLYAAILKIKNIFEGKDPNNIYFNDDSEYNEFCELVKICFEQLNSFFTKKSQEKLASWLVSIKKEFNEFIKENESFHEHFHQHIKALLYTSDIEIDEYPEFICGDSLLLLYQHLDPETKKYVSQLYCFRRIFCALSKIVPSLISREHKEFFQNDKTLIDSFYIIHSEDCGMLSRSERTPIENFYRIPNPMENYYLINEFCSFNLIEFENLLDFLIPKIFESFEDHCSIVQEYLYRLVHFLNEGAKE